MSLPSAEGGLRRYLTEIRKYPLLGKDEEYMLAKRWREHEDPEAAHRLVTSHLRLSAKIALSYRGYGLPLGEVISEGNLGLMHAVKKFDPDKGFRLATYAIWWIRAAIQEYILRSWSLVKLGTSAVQKKLFFNLRRAKARISALSDGDLKPDQVKAIASRLGVNEEEVVNMDRRLASRDASLNSPLAADAEQEWLDVLEDEAAVDPEAAVAEAEERALRMDLLAQAMQTLNARERRIFTARRLQDPPALLEDLAKDFGVSRERVRQIEVRAFEKVQAFVTEGEKRKLREKRRRRAAEVLIARRTADAPVWATA
nr:RNA polymerase sigma factor RpoH [Phenylobacterium zucineum]